VGCTSVSEESDSSSSSGTASSEASNATGTSEASSKPERTEESRSTASSNDRPSERSSAREAGSSSESGTSNARLVAQLNEASRELATLRAANARLRAEGGRASESSSRASTRNDPVDEKLAASVKSYSQFKQDLAAFMAEMEKSRSESSALNTQLKEASRRADDAKAALTRLEVELRKERNARIDAEQAASKLREQLRAIGRAMASAGVNVDKFTTEEPTARLEMNTSRVRGAASDGSRKHIVRAGETLQQLAEKYYGDAGKWRTILDANRGFVRLDGKLEQGMELEIPAK
jgi:nucleoid-associated protein YgaU